MSQVRSSSLVAVSLLAASVLVGCPKKDDGGTTDKKTEPSSTTEGKKKTEEAKVAGCGAGDWKSPDGAFCITVPSGAKTLGDPSKGGAPLTGGVDEFGDPTSTISFQTNDHDIQLHWGTKPSHWDKRVDVMKETVDDYVKAGGEGEWKELHPGSQGMIAYRSKGGSTMLHEVQTKVSNAIVTCDVTQRGNENVDALVDVCKTVKAQ